MSFEGLFDKMPMLVVEVEGKDYARPLYSTDWFALMHAAERTDMWLYRELGCIPRERTWRIVQPSESG